MDKGFDEKALIARAEDTVRLCEKQYAPRAFGFLTPQEAVSVRRALGRIKPDAGTCCTFFGGYPEAERCLFVALPDYLDPDSAWDFADVLEIRGRDIGTLSHRDFLGSLLGLGFRREKIGDILCLEDRCIVFVSSDISDYIIENLTKIGRVGVTAKKEDHTSLEIPKRRIEEIRTTVAALRLDCIVGAALRTSRAAACEVIRAKRVSVNWLECDEASARLSPGDVISIRGAGRFRLHEQINETKKGRLGICIEKSI